MAGIGNNQAGYHGYKSTRTGMETFDITGHPGKYINCEDLAKATTTFLTGSRGNCAGIIFQHSDAAAAGTILNFTGGGTTTGVGLTAGVLYEFSLRKITVVNATNAKVKVLYTKGHESDKEA